MSNTAPFVAKKNVADVLRPVVFVEDMLKGARKFGLKIEEGILVSQLSRTLALLYLLWRSRPYSHRLIDVQETFCPWPRGMLTPYERVFVPCYASLPGRRATPPSFNVEKPSSSEKLFIQGARVTRHE